MPTKKTTKAAEAEETKPKKTAAKKAVKEKTDPKPKAVKKAKAVEPEAVVEPAIEAAPKKVTAKKPSKAAPDQGLGLTPHAESILAAIREGRAVEFIFEDAEANAPRTFEPRQLIYDALAAAWFVWGWDRRYNAERFHRLDLLAEVNAVEGVGRSAQGPYKDGTPGNMIGGWMGGDAIPVKVVLHKQWVFAVKQAPPAFPDFKLEEKEEGKALASFTATDLRAIARWVMQFGDGVTVMEPARLQDRIRQAALAWGAKLPAPSGKPGPAPAPQPSRPEPRHESKHHEPRHHEPRHHEPRHSDEPRRREHSREDREDRAPKQSQNQQVEIRLERL
ncbi:MAG TPA: WYL domain-containing protein [Holophagaceae bacterium]|nr:WYL domain-containing protein [Holophagaceae bacterium]